MKKLILASIACMVLLGGCSSGESSVEASNNHVKMTAKNSGDSDGSVFFTVDETGTLTLTYDVSKGSFDLRVVDGSVAGDSEDVMMEIEEVLEGPAVIEENGLSGTGELEYPIEAGDYAVSFTLHDVTGEASLDATK